MAGKKDKKKTAAKQETLIDSSAEKERFGSKKKNILDAVAMDGLDARNPEYLIIPDGSRKAYASCMYVRAMSKKTRFATTMAPLFSFPGVHTAVIVQHREADEAQRIVDKQVKEYSIQASEAATAGDENLYRKLHKKHSDAERWARRIEAGENSLYKVRFIFVLHAESPEKLRLKEGDLYAKAKTRNINLACAYGMQDVAYRAAYPLAEFPKVPGDLDFIEPIDMDSNSVADLFHHTSNSFIHQDGVFAGHYIHTGKVFTYSPFDRSHDNYGVAIAGGSGSGKSATVKMLQSRLGDFGVRFRTLDVEKKNERGEYAPIAEAMGGVWFDIGPNSRSVINPYEINIEMEYDSVTDMEYPKLYLIEKLTFVDDLFMSMVRIKNATADLSLMSSIRRIVSDVNAALYRERGILEGEPNSLFEKDVSGRIGSGLVKKKLPTLTDAYKKILVLQHINENPLHEKAYQVLVDVLSSRVREIYYGTKTVTFFTREEFNALKTNEYGQKVAAMPDGGCEVVTPVVGNLSYFDGESTIKVDVDTPYIDYDISRIPKEDKEFAMLAVLGFIEQNDVRTNSSNPNHMQPLVIMMDELHKTFPYEEARRIITEFYRVLRKRYGSPWCATQSLRDFDGYEETKAILETSDTKILFRHERQTSDFLKKNTPLTDSQVEQIFKLGIDPAMNVSAEEEARHKGECCFIDKGRVAFVKMDYLMNTEFEFVETDMKKIMDRRKTTVA